MPRAEVIDSPEVPWGVFGFACGRCWRRDRQRKRRWNQRRQVDADVSEIRRDEMLKF